MAYAPIAYTIPQYEDYPNNWLKAYDQGTTTPLAMATDATGGTTLAKSELDTQGFPITAGSARFIPFIDGDYDLWLFPTEAEADANDTTNAIQFADNLNADPLLITDDFAFTGSIQSSYVVADKAEAAALTLSSTDTSRKVFITSDDGGEFTVRYNATPGTYADNGGAYCGTVFIPSGGDGTIGFERDYSGAIYPEWFGAVISDNGASPSAGILTTNTTAIQAAINLSYNDTGTVGNNISIPDRTGVECALSNGDYHVNSLTFPGMMNLKGAGMWQSRLIVHGSITYIKRTDTAFETVWGINVEKLWIRGFVGTEDLIKPGVYSGSADRTEEVMSECNFHNVIVDHGNFGFDWRGWNNSFTFGIIRDCLRGANLDTAFKTSDPYTLIASPDDNDFSGTSFQNCDYPYVERFCQGNNLKTCAFYQNDHTAVTIGEYSRGFLMKGGRCEDSIEREANIQGGQVVSHGGAYYICKLWHTSGASTEPGVGASWATYWDVTTFWTTERIWLTATVYSERNAYNPSFENVNFLRGPSSRIDRSGNAISRAGTYKYAILDGDNYSKFEGCYAGTFIDANFSVTEKSKAANFIHNRDISPSEDGAGSPTYNYLWDNKDYDNQLTKQYGSNEYMAVDKGTGKITLPKLTELSVNSVEITPTNGAFNGEATITGITDTANNVVGSAKNQAAATKLRTDDVFFIIIGPDTVRVQSNNTFDGTQTYTLMVM